MSAMIGNEVAVVSNNSGRTCEFYVTQRGCIKGDTCDFAHPTAPNGTVTNRVCEFFTLARGCTKGAECDFIHPEGLRPRAAQAQQSVCKFFNSANGCKKGASCEFSHPMGGGMGMGMGMGMPPMPGMGRPAPGAKQCDYFFTARGCVKGDSCDFSHGPQTQQPPMFGGMPMYGQQGGYPGGPGVIPGGRPGFGGIQKKQQKCDFFGTERGCIKGDMCDFIHVKEKVCDFFLTERGCRKGKLCDFQHPEGGAAGTEGGESVGMANGAEERAKARAAKRYAPY